MSTDDEPKAPLLQLSPRLRQGIALGLVAIAGAHLIWPTLAIDGVFFGLLGGAGFVMFFDIESLEWQGVKARRRELQEARAALRETPQTSQPALPPAPPDEKSAAKEPPAPLPHAWAALPPTDPHDRLLWVGEQIRLELIILAGNSGRLPKEPFSTLTPEVLVRALEPANVLRPELANAIGTVWSTRNVAVSGIGKAPAIIGLAGDLGLDALQKLREIPTDFVRVRHPDLLLFRDRELTTPHLARGVMLAQVDRNGRISHIHVFPRRLAYLRGWFVTWEWDMRTIHKEQAWYKDPDTGLVKQAFGGAVTFVGREYPEDWQLEFRLPDPDAGLDPSTAAT